MALKRHYQLVVFFINLTFETVFRTEARRLKIRCRKKRIIKGDELAFLSVATVTYRSVLSNMEKR